MKWSLPTSDLFYHNGGPQAAANKHPLKKVWLHLAEINLQLFLKKWIVNIWTLALLSCSEVSIGYLETENFSKMLSWHMKRLRVGFKTYLIMAHNWLKTEGSRWSFFKNFRCCMWVGWLKQSPPPLLFEVHLYVMKSGFNQAAPV